MANQRIAITVRGVVQGVGFRPFVHRLATRLELAGSVKNSTGVVLIEVEGPAASVRQFIEQLQDAPPPASRIDDVELRPLPPTPAADARESQFRIESSDDASPQAIYVSPDLATCDDCLAELRDPTDRRFGYAFLNCTNCGPRLTIITAAPYDRQRTTMARFEMCPACAAEYHDPGDRRFHAQPIACPACGPSLQVCRASGEVIATDAPLTWFAARVLRGEIGALQGLGGFHLVCVAGDNRAVHRLRKRKHRDEKPFAIMVPDISTARHLCEVDPHESELLQSPRRPIVLLQRRIERPPQLMETANVCDAVAPGNPALGVMLPYTPLHHLLMDAVQGVPLVMTSGNRADEPIVTTPEQAQDRLGDIADVFLIHDRPIRVRCDDSVTRLIDGQELPIRRSRGYAPLPIRLPMTCDVHVLAVGGQLKGVFALGRDRQAFLSHHLGDLDDFAAYQAFQQDVTLYEQLFEIQPQLIVHDMHPDYASTQYARRRAAEEGIALLEVQHHHAHLASCLAEHGLSEPAIGVCLDGTGFGPDGAIWGGEFLVGDYAGYTRAAQLRYVRLPGGDQAIREPWRIAVSQLRDAGCDIGLANVTAAQRSTIERMIERGFNAPFTSSMGRLFDAVAAIVGIRSQVSYEGQAAMELEWLAMQAGDEDAYPFAVETATIDTGEETRVVDTRPLIRAVVADATRGTNAARIARRFHTTVVEMIGRVCRLIRADTRLDLVALSGGVFQNSLLTREACRRLERDGFRVYRHRQVPPNDAGLCLGQLAVAAALQQGLTPSRATLKAGCQEYAGPSAVPSPGRAGGWAPKMRVFGGRFAIAASMQTALL